MTWCGMEEVVISLVDVVGCFWMLLVGYRKMADFSLELTRNF